jgi:hypothetical protein
MILFWLLCVSLVLGGLAFRRELLTILDGLWLHVFGVPVRARTSRPALRACTTAPPRRHDPLPPPRVSFRAGP